MYKIAVFTDNDLALTNFYECTCITVYGNGDGEFRTLDTVNYKKTTTTSPAGIRRDTEVLLKFIDGCSAVVFKEILGIPFSVFDKAGLNIFTVDEFLDKTLKEIANDLDSLKKENEEQEEMTKKAVPIELNIPGVYYFDLVELQTKYPEISSKKAIKDFLDNTPFLELRLVCSHIPPWIEKDSRFDIKTEKGVFAVIAIKQC